MNRAQHFGLPQKAQDTLCFPQISYGVFNGRCRFFYFFFHFCRKLNLMPPFRAAVLADGRAGDIEHAGNVFLLHPLLPQVLGEGAPQRRDDVKRFNFLRQEELFNHS